MRGLLFLILLLRLSFSNSDLQSQNIESDCECDVIITEKDQSFPYDGYQESRNKTICFQGDFDYEINWNKLGNNITLCVGEEVSFKSNGLNFEGSKSIYNYGTFEFGQSLVLDENSSIFNYGEMESIFTFNGGSLQNLNNSELVVIGYSNFNSGNVFNDYTSKIEIKQNEYTNIGENMTFNSQGEVVFNGNVDNKGELTLAGISEFKKKLINNNLANLSGELKFEEGYNSNSNDAVTIANGFLEIDGDVNLWNGLLKASAGLEFSKNTTVENDAKIKFLGEAKFENLTLRGEIFTDFSCNSIDIKKFNGYAGKISANSNSSIYVKRFNKIPNSWILNGNVTKDKCDNDSNVVVWLGSKSVVAEDSDNWSGKLTNKSSILIPETRFNPTINDDFVIYDIFVNEGAVVNNTSSIKLQGDLKIEGKLNSKEGIIEFNGKQVQTINLNSKTEVGSLIIDNSDNVELKNGSIDVYKNIELLNGNLITNHSGTTPEENLITFKSDSTRTAILKEVVGSSRIIGAVRIERYLPSSNRAYRYLSSSVNTTGSIRDNWQENVNNTENNYNSNKNPNPGYGTHITGSKQGNKGFDASLTGNPSLFTWNINSGNWLAISNTDQNTLEAGKAYSILIRGDRSTNIYSSNSAYTGSTTLRSTGEIVTGDVDLSHELNKTPNGFSLIGNPYQAQVDLKRAMIESSSNLKRNFYYAWTPALQTRGGYVTVDLSSEPVEYVPSGKNLNSNKQDNYRYIQPNQSVFIETAPSASEQNQPSLVFKEKHKTDNSISNEVFSIPEQIGKIDLTLIRKKDSQIVDGVRFKFNNNYDNEVNQNDATKVWNNEESFSILSNQANYLAIEKRQYPEVGEKLKFWIGNYTSQDYTMLVSLTEIEGYEVYIKDNYTGDILKLDDGDNKFDFNVDSSISESSSSDRFEITFEPVTLGTENIEVESDFQLYPNPSSTGAVYIKYDAILGNEIETEVYSMIGKRMKVTSNRVSNSEVKLNTSSLSTGIYLVKLSNGSYTTTKKLVINN